MPNPTKPTPKDSYVTLSVREYNQLLATLMEARGWFDLQRKSGRMWPSAPEGVLAAAQRLLAEKGFQQALAANLDNHVIEFRKSGWTIMHPLSCRPDLFKCKVNRAAEVQITNAPKELGRFRCELDDDGQFVVGARAD